LTVTAGRVTAGLFPLLAVAPILGSNFTEADERSDDAVILSYGSGRSASPAHTTSSASG
jgi:hypothetical protein